MRSSRVREGFAPGHPSAASFARGAKGERPGVGHGRTAKPASLPPASDAVSILDVEEPLLAPDDQKGGDGGEEADDGDDDPAHEAVGRVAHAPAHGLPTAELIHAHRVFDGVVQPVDGGEGRIPDADSIRAHDAFGIEVGMTGAVEAGGEGRVVCRDRALGTE
jgi:hypothetical protein